MTCIAAVVSGSVVFMGADSVHASSHAIYARDEPKIFQNGDMLIGAAGGGGDAMTRRCRIGCNNLRGDTDMVCRAWREGAALDG